MIDRFTRAEILIDSPHIPRDCARFRICFSHNPAVPPICCVGEVYRPRLGDPVVKIDEPIPAIPVGGVVRVVCTLTNPGTSVIRVPLLFLAEDGALDLEETEEPGLAIGSSIATQVVSISPRASEKVTIPVRLPADSGSDIAPLAIYVGASSLEDIAKVGVCTRPMESTCLFFPYFNV